jgi:carbamoyl-phosphate synthase large subunit
MNILLTCAGRRNYLVEYFRKAMADCGQVYAADMNADVPALQEADKALVLPPIYQDGYLDNLVALCQMHQIRLLISLSDIEVKFLAEQRELFFKIGTIPIISSSEVVNTCLDKWATLAFLKSCGLPTPKTYLSLAMVRKALCREEIAFPLVVKPRWGSASISVDYVEDYKELEFAYNLTMSRIGRAALPQLGATDPERSVLIQEQLMGQEYGLDVINDLNGRYVTTFARRKLAMRAGETDRAVTVVNDQYTKLGEAIGQRLGHIGNLDCDVFMDGDCCYVLELNPRFGGGYPFSHTAGANLPAALVAWANGEEPKADWLRVRPNVTAAKCDGLIAIEKIRLEDSALLHTSAAGF